MLTMATESLAAMARMSAQDTTPGQAFSSADLMSSMIHHIESPSGVAIGDGCLFPSETCRVVQ